MVDGEKERTKTVSEKSVETLAGGTRAQKTKFKSWIVTQELGGLWKGKREKTMEKLLDGKKPQREKKGRWP